MDFVFPFKFFRSFNAFLRSGDLHKWLTRTSDQSVKLSADLHSQRLGFS